MPRTAASVSPASASLNRRAAIGGGIASVALAIAPEAAHAGLTLSPEYYAYVQLDDAYVAACIDDSPDRGGPEHDRIASEAGDACWNAIDAILARPVSSWADVIEISEIVRRRIWDEDAQEFQSSNGDLERALMGAIREMARRERINV